MKKVETKKEVYTKADVMQILKIALMKYSTIELSGYWKDEYVGNCVDRLEIRKTDSGYEIELFNTVC